MIMFQPGNRIEFLGGLGDPLKHGHNLWNCPRVSGTPHMMTEVVARGPRTFWEKLRTDHNKGVMAYWIKLYRRLCSATSAGLELKRFSNVVMRETRSPIFFPSETISCAQVCQTGALSSRSNAYLANARQQSLEGMKSSCCLIGWNDNLPDDTTPRGSAENRRRVGIQSISQLLALTFRRPGGTRRAESYMITGGLFGRDSRQPVDNHFLLIVLLQIEGFWFPLDRETWGTEKELFVTKNV